MTSPWSCAARRTAGSFAREWLDLGCRAHVPASPPRPPPRHPPPPLPAHGRRDRRAGADAPGVHGDELSDARARQAQLKKDVAAQRAQVAQLAASRRTCRPTSTTRRSSCAGSTPTWPPSRTKITSIGRGSPRSRPSTTSSSPSSRLSMPQLLQVQAEEASKGPSELRAGRNSPSGSGTPTTPTGHRCWSRSCRATRSPTC